MRAFPKLTIKQPLSLTPEPGTNRLFILQHLNFWAGPGRLLAVPDDQDASEAETLLEIDGLAVGLAFHPDYERNGYLYIGLNGPMAGDDKTTQVVRYTVDRRPPHRIDPNSKLLIIEWPSNGHDGGDLAFGNDGYLYVSSGDGSSDSDANLTGQTLDDLLAAVLRIDVDHPDPGRNYGVPKDNPFVDRPGARAELWAYGLRNPWRLSYDRESGQLWVGQNGQDLWEQVYLIQKGANYGWSLTEGSHVFQRPAQGGPRPDLAAGRRAPPQRGPLAHRRPGLSRHSLARPGRGLRLRRLVHRPRLGDQARRHEGHLAPGARRYAVQHHRLRHRPRRRAVRHRPGQWILSPRADDRGRPALAAVPDPAERDGPVRVGRRPQAAPGRASVRGRVRRSGPTGRRWSGSPPCRAWSGSSRSPSSTRAARGPCPTARSWCRRSASTVADGGKPARKRVETRLLVRQQGEWTGYSYRWNAAQTDADLVPAAGAPQEFEVADPAEPSGRREQTWRFPARTECMVCHSRAAGFILGFTPLQLDRDRDYGGTIDNQLRTLEHIGVFQGTLPARARGSAAAGQPLRGAGAAGGPGPIVPARQLLDLPRPGGGRQLPHGAGADNAAGRDAADR